MKPDMGSITGGSGLRPMVGVGERTKGVFLRKTEKNTSFLKRQNTQLVCEWEMQNLETFHKGKTNFFFWFVESDGKCFGAIE